MAARRIIHLTLDVGRGRFVSADYTRVLDENDIELIRGDEENVFRITCVISNNGGQSYAAFGFAGGTTFKLTAKDPSAITGSDALILEDSAWNDTDDWGDANAANGNICVRFSTNTANLTTFLSASGADAKRAVMDIEVTEPGAGVFTAAWSFLNLRNDVRRGTEGTPAPTSPTYVTTTDFRAVMPTGLRFADEGGRIVIYYNDNPIASLP